MCILNKPYKLITLLGPTATGKTKLAIKLARKFNGEIISADSRQVYKYMHIGTGKDLDEYGKGKDKVAYHLIDIIKPTTQFNLAKYKKIALKSIEDIIRRGKLPFLVGGTGLYISAIIEDYHIPPVKPDTNLRKKLEATPLSKLVNILKKKDPEVCQRVDLKNKRRVIRALEITKSRLNDRQTDQMKNKSKHTHTLILGMKIDRKVVKQKIDQRVDKMIKQGLIGEVKKLHKKHNLPWKKLEEFGMEYKYPALYLRGKINKTQMIERIKTTNHQFAKRQMTWFRGMERRGTKINWVVTYQQAERLIRNFI